MHTMPFPRCPLPPTAQIKQHLSSSPLADGRAEVRQRLRDSGLRDRIKPDTRIATRTLPSRNRLPLYLSMRAAICCECPALSSWRNGDGAVFIQSRPA